MGWELIEDYPSLFSHRERTINVRKKVIEFILRLPTRYLSSELFSVLNVFSFDQLYDLHLLRLGRDFTVKAENPTAEE